MNHEITEINRPEQKKEGLIRALNTIVTIYGIPDKTCAYWLERVIEDRIGAYFNLKSHAETEISDNYKKSIWKLTLEIEYSTLPIVFEVINEYEWSNVDVMRY